MGITNPAEQHFERGQWGFDGTLWRKLPMVWGFTDGWVGQAANENADAGVNYLELAAIPTGEVWTAYVVSAIDVNTNPAAISFGIYITGGRKYFWIVPSPGANTFASWASPQIFTAGDIPSVAFEGCAANDYIVARWWGYKMAVA